VHIDVDRVLFSAVTVGGREVWQESVPVDLRRVGSGGGPTLRAILLTQLAKLPADTELLAVEVGLPGYVARERGTVIWAEAFDWRDFELHQLVTECLAQLGIRDIHVRLANDCHLAALHACRLELELPSDAVALYVGGLRSLGGGLVIGGEIFRGANGVAGDFGHCNTAGGRRCRCGRESCLHSIVNLSHLLSSSSLLTAREADALVDEDPRAAVQVLLDAAARADQDALRTLQSAGEAVGRSIDDLVGAIDPHVVVLGGYFGALADYLLGPIGDQLRVRTASPPFETTHVVAVSQLMRRVVGGAALAARDACLNDPLQLTRVLVDA
jgi:predicted NBD/HSP70 family sugar kinase